MTVLTSNCVRIENSTLKDAMNIVDASGLVQWASSKHAEALGTYKGGAKAVFTWRPLFIGLALVAMTEQPMILRDVVRTLNALTGTQKRNAGVPEQVTERMVSRRWLTFIDLVDPSPYSNANRDLVEELTETEWDSLSAQRDASLRFVMDALLGASIPERYVDEGNYAVDATGVPSWAKQKSRHKNKDTSTDPDAAWRVHDSTRVPHGNEENKLRFGAKSWYGYWLHAFVRIPEMKVGKNGTVTMTDTPSFIERIDVTSAGTDMAVDAAKLLARMVAQKTNSSNGFAAGDIVMDRAYSLGYERFLEPARAFGFLPHFAMRADQLGVHGDVRGMLIVDGQPFSPRMPAALRNITPPKVPGSPKADIDAWQAEVAKRAPYAIKLRGSTTSGVFDLSCPAARDFGAMRCGNKPESLLLPATIPLAPPRNVGKPLPDICAKQRIRVNAEDLPLWQPHLHGSSQWWASMGRRSRVEGAFGNLKNDATQSLCRGRIRVRGLAKTALMAAFLCVASNMRTAKRFEAAVNQAPRIAPPTPRGPRARTRRIERVRAERVAAAQQAAAQAAAP